MRNARRPTSAVNRTLYASPLTLRFPGFEPLPPLNSRLDPSLSWEQLGRAEIVWCCVPSSVATRTVNTSALGDDGVSLTPHPPPKSQLHPEAHNSVILPRPPFQGHPRFRLFVLLPALPVVSPSVFGVGGSGERDTDISSKPPCRTSTSLKIVHLSDFEQFLGHTRPPVPESSSMNAESSGNDPTHFNF